MRLTIGGRLAIGFGVMIVLLGVLAGNGWNQSRLTQQNVGLLNRKSQQVQAADLLEQLGHRSGARVTEYLLNPSNPDTLKGVQEFRDKFAAQLETLKGLANQDQTRQTLAQIETNFAGVWTEFDELKRLTTEAEQLSHQTLPDSIGSVSSDLTKLVSDADAAGNVAARAAARQAKVVCLEAYLAVRQSCDTMTAEDKANAEKAIEAATKSLAAAGTNAEFGPFAARFAPIAARFGEFNHAFESIVTDKAAVSKVLAEKFHPKRRAAVDMVADLAKSIAAEADATGKSVSDSAARSKVFSLAMGVSVALVGIAFGFFSARSITRPIQALISRVIAIQQAKDLSQRVHIQSRDEVGEMGDAFNGLIDTLHDIISEVKNGASQIDAGGSQIASASQSLAQGASEQASNLQQISASLEQMAGQTQQSAENARQASTLAEDNKKSADRGRIEMEQMNRAVSEIKQSSSEISKIIKVIDEIAFQTNLLALNAAVEAARAGEAGKGFAVVAEEVRNLAQRSAEAAKNTASMIEESVKRSENGVQIAGRVGQALEEITSATTKVNTLLAEIATAATEQATGIGQVNKGVSQLDQVTQQNAGNSEEMASSAEELSAQVASLNELVAQFKVKSSHAAQPSAGGRSKPLAPVQPPKTPLKLAKSPAVPALTPATTAAGAPAPDPEAVIPMNDDETLASF